MVPRWKKLSIRVFVAARESFDGTTQSTSSEEECGTDLEGNTIYSNQRYTLLLRTYVDSNWDFICKWEVTYMYLNLSLPNPIDEMLCTL